MKALFQFIFPTLKAVAAVVSVLVGMGWAAYSAVSVIAKTEAGTVREEIKEIRTADMQHIDKNFTYLHQRFDKIEEMIRKK